MSQIYEAVSGMLDVKEQPNISAKSAGSALQSGARVNILKIERDSMGNTWGQHSQGWSPIVMGSNTLLKNISNTSSPSNVSPILNVPTSGGSEVYFDDDMISESTNRIRHLYNITSDAVVNLRSMRSVIGMPHQFLGTVDERVPNSLFGRMFTENILMDMPLCTIIPGGPAFLRGKSLSRSQKQGLAQTVANAAESTADAISDTLEQILGGSNARYYSFDTQYTDYMNYVNTLNRTMSQFLGIHNRRLRPSAPTYQNFDWKGEHVEDDLGRGLSQFVGNLQTVNIYFDKAGTNVNENSSNSTDKSMLEGALNNASNMSKEAEFLFGVAAGRTFDAMRDEVAEQKINVLTDDISNAKNMFDGIVTNLKAGATTTIAGANMLLPEIWRDSSFTRQYSIDVTLVSPYGTEEAFFLNVGVPLNFLIALAFPRQFGANAYSSPFIIQAFSKGLFNCDLGIIESIDITRAGSGDSISRSRLPLEVRVGLNIRELYSSMSVSTSQNYGAFVNNRGLLDFLATLSAVNLSEPDLVRKLNMLLQSKLNVIRDIPGNIESKVYDWFRDSVLQRLKY